MNYDRCIYCNVTRAKWPKLRFFRFPKDEVRCKKWISACNLESQLNVPASIMYQKYRICSRHFQDCDFVSNKKIKLLSIACPSKFESLEINISNLQESLKSKLANQSATVSDVDETAHSSNSVLECKDEGANLLQTCTSKERLHFTETEELTKKLKCSEPKQGQPGEVAKILKCSGTGQGQPEEEVPKILECSEAEQGQPEVPKILKCSRAEQGQPEVLKILKCSGAKQGQPEEIPKMLTFSSAEQGQPQEVPKKLHLGQLHFLIPLIRLRKEQLAGVVQIPEHSNIIQNVKQEPELIIEKETNTEVENSILIRSPRSLKGRFSPNLTDAAKKKLDEALNSRNTFETLSEDTRLSTGGRNPIIIRSPRSLKGISLPNSTETPKEKVDQSLNSGNTLKTLSEDTRLSMNERNSDKYGNRAFLLSFLPVMDSYPPHLCLEARTKIAKVFGEMSSSNVSNCNVATVELPTSQKTSC